MKTTEQKRNPIITTLMLSLLLHLALILYFIIKQKAFMSSDTSLTEEILKKNLNSPWAETKQRASSFGAPVLFRNEMDNNSEPDTPQEQTNPIAFEPAEENNEPSALLEKTSANKWEKAESHPKQAPIIQEAQKPLALAATPPEKKIMTPKKPLAQPPVQPYSAPKITQSEPKKKLSLAQLTQGFLNHVKDTGNHAVTMIGKKNSAPTDEQLKYERYLEKLSWCLQNSFSINNDKFPGSSDSETTVNILLALNKDGSLHHLNLAKSSGDIKLDQFALFVFKDASSSFPPVPTYLPHNPFVITYTIGINMRENSAIRLYRR